MTGRIEGLSIGLDMEAASISRSMSEIRRTMRGFNSEAKVTTNNMKFGARDTKSFEKNMSSLSETTDKQRKNVEDLGKEYTRVVEEKGATSKKAQELALEFNKQADNLNRLESQLESAKDELHGLYVEQSNFTSMGNVFDKAGSGIQTFGSGVRDVGGSLTRWITAPIMGAITAAGGLTAAFGWGRLTGLDNAKAQLEGMGYSMEEVDSITDEVSDAIQGGMMTMAEGTATAAGAMAAGVEQGDELAKYLQLVDAAAVGANRPVNEMAQIFNRVQGSGKLMTQELNMIEDGMPGFSQTMADHLGVSMDEFREMVTAGEVSSGEFLEVMDGFAGGMAEAYSGTWSGMVQNTKAWIGILGESLLGGVFEQSKASIGEFIELLKSDAAQTWAADMGEKIGSAFSSIIEHIKGAVTWFMGLDNEKKKLIGTIAGIVVAAGPFLTIFGTMTIFIGKVVSALAPLFFGLGRLSGGLKTVISGVKPFAAVFPKLAGFIGLLTGPVGWITAGIIALGTAFTVAYARSETFRNVVNGLAQRFIEFLPTVQQFGQTIYKNFMNLITPAFQAVRNFGIDMFQKIKQFWQSDGQQTFQAFMNIINVIRSVVSAAMPYIQTTITVAFRIVLSVIRMVWQNIKGVISGGLDVIMGLVRVFTGIFTGDFSKMWQGVKQIFSGAIQAVWNGFQLLFWGRIIRGVGSLVRAFSGSIRGLWQNVVSFFQNMYQGAVQRVGNLRTSAVNLASRLNSGFNNIISRMVNAVIGFFRNMLSRGVSIVRNLYRNTTSTASNLRTSFVNTISNLVSRVIQFFMNLFSRGQRIISNLRQSVVNLITRMRDGAVSGVSRMRDRLVDLFTRVKDRASQLWENMVEGAKALPGKLGSAIRNGASKAVDGVKSLGNRMAGKLGDVVNGVIKGLNSISSKIGISATISEWKVPKFSKGTGQGSPTGNLTKQGRIAMDTLAKVGDKGPGNGKGTRELVHYPNGQVGLYDNDATIFAPKGTTIFSNKETESLLNQIPRFSEGTGLWGRIKQIASKAVDYITNPGKIFEDLVNTVGNKFSDLRGFAADLIKGVWNKIKDGMLGWMTDRFSESSVGKSQKWMDYRMTTPYSPNRPVPGYPTAFNGGRHYGIDYGTPVGVNLTAPMAGKVTRQRDLGGGIVARLQSGNASQYFLHMSSVKSGSVGIGQSLGRTGNTGRFTTGPHVHWQHEEPKTPRLWNRNTKNPLDMIEGHSLGGYIKDGGLFNLHDDEYVIPMTKPSEAMKLIALASKQLAGKSKQTSQLPNPGNTGSERLSKVEDKLDKMIQLMQLLVEKDTDIKLNGRSVKEEMDNIDYDDDMIQRLLKGRKKGVPAT